MFKVQGLATCILPHNLSQLKTEASHMEFMFGTCKQYLLVFERTAVVDQSKQLRLINKHNTVKLIKCLCWTGHSPA